MLLLGLIITFALALRAPFALRRHYHTDEYRSLERATRVLDGDVFLTAEPSQKPPLFYVLLAGVFAITGPSDFAAVGVNLVLSLASVAVVDAIARALYRDAVLGLLAAWFVAASLFHILFSPTIFLDPAMVLLALLGWLAALRGRPLASGALGALSVATKQQGLLFLPLAAASLSRGRKRRGGQSLGWAARRWGVGVISGAGALVLWGLGARTAPLHFVSGQVANEQSAIGGSLVVNPLAEGLGALAERFQGWWRFEALLLANAWVTALAVIGLAVVVAHGLVSSIQRRRLERDVSADTLVLAALVALASLHVFIRFRYVDRYVLPLVPLLALALARALAAGMRSALGGGTRAWLRAVALGATAVVVATPLWAYAHVRQVAVIDGRKLGVLHDTRADLKPFLEALGASLGPGDEIYCDPFTQSAAAFFLRPRRVFDVSEGSLHRLDGAPARGVAAGAASRRFLVWWMGLPLEPLRRRLAPGWVLVPVAASASGVQAFRLDPAEGG